MRLLVIFCFLLLSACATQMPKTVKIPIAVKPDIHIPEKPQLDINNLTLQSSDADVMKSCVITIVQQQQYINNLSLLLNATQN